MSETKRRDITLGEMQDECKKRDGMCCGIESWDVCAFYNVCPFQMQSSKALAWDLSDPPRFNEAQMALLKALRGLGFVSIENIGSGGFKTTSEDGKTGLFMALLGINYGETLDLAELLGKDGAE